MSKIIKIVCTAVGSSTEGSFTVYYDTSVSPTLVVGVNGCGVSLNNVTAQQLLSGITIVAPDNVLTLYIYNNSGVCIGRYTSVTAPGVSPTPTPTTSVTPTVTPTTSITPTITPTTSITPSITTTVTPTVTPTNSVTPTITPTVTPTNSVTPSVTPTVTPSITTSNSVTPTVTPSITTSNSVTPTVTPTVTPSITTSNSVTPTVTPSITPSETASPSVTPSLTPSETTSPSVTPTVTPSRSPAPTPSPTTPAQTAFTDTTGYATATLACRNGFGNSTKYLSPAFAVPTVGEFVYNDVNLTTPYDGGSNYHWMTISPTIYAVQIGATGQITDVVDCSTIPSVTPSVTPTITPTITPTNSITPTITPTVTPSITTSTSVTPTITPTRTPSVTPTRTPAPTPSPTTPAQSAFTDTTGYANATLACRNGFGNSTKYLSPAFPTPTVGQFVYNDTGLTSPYNGGSNYHWMTISPTVWAVQIGATGQITDVVDCSTIPSNTPSPSLTPTPTTTPSSTPAPTPSTSPSLTPTPTPTPSPSSLYNYYEFTACSTGIPILRRSLSTYGLGETYTFQAGPSRRECYTVTDINAAVNTNDIASIFGPWTGCTDSACLLT